MAQHQEEDIDSKNGKEEIVSTSPDSAINLSFDDDKPCDKNSTQITQDAEASSSPSTKRIQCNNSGTQNTLYPFYYKYPDNRKLTLLKSLSQDSEYSLDTSLFDAEDFLQEMGFAGSADPTIPDRFLPSLMQRLSKFPESEMESLNDRIIQSIGCFKRKEGKRRLFRNLSMGKVSNADNVGGNNLLMYNNYPLHRSNTGPASFSFNDDLSNVANPETRHINKLNLTNSNNSSFAEEEEFVPKSPIAILVSSASVDKDLEEKVSLNIDTDISSVKNTKECISIDLVNSDQCESKRDMKTDELIGNDTTVQNEELKIRDLETALNEQEPLTTAPISKEDSKIDQTKSNPKSIFNQTDKSLIENSSPKEFKLISYNSEPLLFDNHKKASIVKIPLRRLTKTTNFNSMQNVGEFGAILCDYPDTKSIKNEMNHSVIDTFRDTPKSSVFDSSVELSEASSFSEKEEESMSESTDQNFLMQASDNCGELEKSSNIVGVEVEMKYSKIKPKYTRDDSLTNFLSSMLYNNNDTLSPNSTTTDQTFDFSCSTIKNSDKSVEITLPSPQKENPLKNSELFSYKNTPKTNSNSNTNREIKEKSSNRKRRMLRRMSSSFNYYDEEIPVRTSEPPVHTQQYSSLEFPSPCSLMPPKLPLRNTLSAPQVSSCPIVYPCCCLPTVNMPSCLAHHGDVHKSCSDLAHFSHFNASDSKNYQRTNFSNRRSKRCLNSNRYSSCPPSMVNMTCNSCCHSHSQNLNTASHNSFCHYCLPFSRYVSPQSSFFSQECLDRETRVTSNYHGGYSSDPPNPTAVKSLPNHQDCKCKDSSLHLNSFLSNNQQNSYSPNITDHSRWSSIPDVRKECFSHQNSNERFKEENYKINDTTSKVSSSGFGFGSLVFRKTNSHGNVFDCDSNIPLQSDKRRCNLKSSDMPTYRIDKEINSSVADTPKYPTYIPQSSPSVFSNKERIVIGNSKQKDQKTKTRLGMALKASHSFPFQSREASNYNVQQIRRMSSVDEPYLGAVTKDDSVIHTNNSEVLQEKKIRVFSKFLTNLENISKSSDTTHKGKITGDFTLADKMTESYRCNNKLNKQLSSSDKLSTSSPELDKLVKILNALDLSKQSRDFDQVTHLNYDGAESKTICNEAPIYENKVILEKKNCSQPLFTPTSYTSSVSLQINDNELQLDKKREAVGTVKRSNSLHNISLQMPFKEVSKELEELQLSIQKAKEMRISASKELHLLQELLSRDASDDQEPTNEKKNTSISFEQDQKNVFMNEESSRQKALADLREKSTDDSDDALFWKEEMKKMKIENDEAWRVKLDRMEEKLASKEEEIHRLESEKESLQKQLHASASPTCVCRTDVVQNGFGRIDSAFEDDEEYTNHKSSIPIQSMRQKCERLQEQLTEAEQRADQLNLLLNHKQIELNKLQLTFSKQTKEMIELEKSYLQLQYRLRKGTSKPMVAKLCSRMSPFNSKNLCPRPSPPASPHPNGVS